MMEPLRVTGTYWYSEADIMAQVTEDRGVKMWFEYKNIRQQRHEFTCTPQQGDRLVTWVEWQRRDRVGGEGEDDDA